MLNDSSLIFAKWKRQRNCCSSVLWNKCQSCRFSLARMTLASQSGSFHCRRQSQSMLRDWFYLKWSKYNEMIKDSHLLFVVGQWAVSCGLLLCWFSVTSSKEPSNGKFFPFILKCCLHIKQRNSDEAFHCATHKKNMLGSCWALLKHGLKSWHEIII